MTWSRFDDAAPKHPKAGLAGNDAWALWAAAVMYCNRYLTDGFVTIPALARECLPVPISTTKARRLAERLCDARLRPDGPGLFERTAGGYMVHDFLAWNPSKIDIEAKRRRDRHRKKFQTEFQTESARIPDGIPDGKIADSERASPARAPAGVSQPSPAIPSPPKLLARAREGRQQRPSNLGDALEVPLTERAALVERDPMLGDLLEVQRWPEVVAVAAALGVRNLGAYGRDRGVVAVCALYAAGFTRDELERAAVELQAQDWWRKERRGLSSLSPEVVRRALATSKPRAEGGGSRMYTGELVDGVTDDELGDITRKNLQEYRENRRKAEAERAKYGPPPPPLRPVAQPARDREPSKGTG